MRISSSKIRLSVGFKYTCLFGGERVIKHGAVKQITVCVCVCVDKYVITI